ncbi:MAG: hypothetical protein GW893_07620 [Armatimonadetes bacterium]|nr:hypothetical protein [Armatimonadota bacterium]
MKELEPDRVGVAVGVRVYPGTELARENALSGRDCGFVGGDDETTSLFFVEPGVATVIFEYLHQLIGSDERFLFFDPDRPEQNCNYNANERLSEAIE